MLAAGPDLWGEASLKLPDGPSYEYFVPLLPPMRYCDAPFRHYPITLSAPGAVTKARYVSNGSAINALARQPNWVGETGHARDVPRHARDAVFGDDLARLDGPRYEQGYLPIVQSRTAPAGRCSRRKRSRRSTRSSPQHGVVLVRFTLAEGTAGDAGHVEAQVEGTSVLQAVKGVVSGKGGEKAIVAYDERWGFRPGRSTLRVTLQPGESAFLAIYTTPAEQLVKVDQALVRRAAEAVRRRVERAARPRHERRRCPRRW